MACGGLTYLRAPSERMIGLLLRTPAAARSRRCREGPEFLFSRCTDWVRAAAQVLLPPEDRLLTLRRTTNPGAGYEHHSLDCSRPARQITDSRQAATGPCVGLHHQRRRGPKHGKHRRGYRVLGLAMPRQACASGMRSRRWVVPSLPGGPPPSDDLHVHLHHLPPPVRALPTWGRRWHDRYVHSPRLRGACADSPRSLPCCHQMPAPGP